MDKFQPDTAHAPIGETLVSLFEHQVELSKDRPAVVFNGQTLTYQELNHRANQLARELLATGGITPETPVAVALDRSDQAVVALLAVMKSGGVYLPIDPKQPDARIQTILRISRASIVIGSSQLRTNPEIKIISPAAGANREGHHLDFTVTPASAAYIIFTSGSTGTPKGVVVEHRQIASMILEQKRMVAMTAEDRVVQLASLGFDAAISEIFMALLSGAALLPATREQVADAKELCRFAGEHQVTVATFPPSYLRVLRGRLWHGLRVVISAGEPGDPDILKSIAQKVACFNAYGPTETAVCATMHRVISNEEYPDYVPIGSPLRGIRVYMLDRQCKPVPIGIRGEIYIAGPTVARGYLSEEEQTREAFMPDPFHPEQRMFKTGDEGCWLENGLIRIFGRTDDQIKIRGHRIEPEEVRCAMMAAESITDAVVVKKQFGDREQLVGYYLSADPPDHEMMRDHLLQRIPPYMVPSVFIHLDAMPKTQSGKVDRSALPIPVDPSTRSEGNRRLPCSENEERISKIWSEVLGGAAPICCDTSFFELGGNSLCAIKVAFALEERFGIELEVAQMFTHPTVRAQARLVEQTLGLKTD